MNDTIMTEKCMKNDKSDGKIILESTSMLIRPGSRSKMRHVFSKRASQSILRLWDGSQEKIEKE